MRLNLEFFRLSVFLTPPYFFFLHRLHLYGVKQKTKFLLYQSVLKSALLVSSKSESSQTGSDCRSEKVSLSQVKRILCGPSHTRRSQYELLLSCYRQADRRCKLTQFTVKTPLLCAFFLSFLFFFFYV